MLYVNLHYPILSHHLPPSFAVAFKNQQPYNQDSYKQCSNHWVGPNRISNSFEPKGPLFQRASVIWLSGYFLKTILIGLVLFGLIQSSFNARSFCLRFFVNNNNKNSFNCLTHLHKAEITIQKHIRGGDLKTKWGGNFKGKIMGETTTGEFQKLTFLGIRRSWKCGHT